ncbi:MAG: T9SS type A sorting domain-containing protein [Salibacteraceae bacterium]
MFLLCILTTASHLGLAQKLNEHVTQNQSEVNSTIQSNEELLETPAPPPPCTMDTTWLPTAHFCNANQAMLFGSTVYGTSGVAYSEIYINSEGCDSIAVQNYIVYSTWDLRSHERIWLCEGDSLLVDSVWVTENHNFNYQYITQHGCDSTHRVSVRIAESYEHNNFISLIDDDSVFIDGLWYSGSGTVTSTYTSINGCDSVVTTIVSHVESGQCNASSNSSEWQFAIGGIKNEQVMDMETDRCGNMYVLLEKSGFYLNDQQGHINFDPVGGGNDVTDGNMQALLKYDSEGHLIWMKKLPFKASALAISADNKLALTGKFRGGIDFDLREAFSHTISSQDDLALFVAVYNLNAELDWVEPIVTLNNYPGNFYNRGDRSGDVAFGLNDEVVVSSYIGSDYVMLDQDSIYTGLLCEACGGSAYRRVVFNFDNDGGFQWNKSFFTSGQCDNTAGWMENVGVLKVDHNNDIVFSYVGCAFGMQQMGENFVIKKLNGNSGNEDWTVNYEAAQAWESDYIKTVEIDHEDNIYLLGHLSQVIQPDPADQAYQVYPYTGSGALMGYGEDALMGTDRGSSFLAKYNSEGEHVWSFAQMPQAGVESFPTHQAPAFDFKIIGQSLVLSGQTLRDIDIDPNPQSEYVINKTFPSNYNPEPPNFDTYVAVYDLDANVIDGWVNGGEGEQGSAFLAGDLNGYLRLAGTFIEDVVLHPDSFASPAVQSNGGRDTYFNSLYIDSSHALAEVHDTLRICEGDTVSYAGQLFYEPGTYFVSAELMNTFFYANHYVDVIFDSNAVITVLDTISLCLGDSTLVNGSYESEAGVFTNLIENSEGCDSLLQTVLTMNDSGMVSSLINSGSYLKADNVSGSFYWYSCSSGSLVDSTTLYYYQPLDSNYYYVIVDAPGYCAAPSECASIAEVNKRNDRLQVKGYPAVVTSDYTLQFDKLQGEVDVRLFDMQGRLLFSNSYFNTQIIILPFKHVAEGLYILMIDNQFHQEALRFMKASD